MHNHRRNGVGRVHGNQCTSTVAGTSHIDQQHSTLRCAATQGRYTMGTDGTTQSELAVQFSSHSNSSVVRTMERDNSGWTALPADMVQQTTIARSVSKEAV